MRYLIIGLGIYGTNLAHDLTDMGHEVIGADIVPEKVEQIKDYISTAYIIDSTDETSLKALPLKNVDLTIVAIGENFGASVKTVALLKKNGVENIYARAIDSLHESILEGLNVARVITPEQRAARDLSFEMELGSNVKSLRVDDDYYVVDFVVPKYFNGMRYSDLVADRMFGLQLIAASRLEKETNVLGISNESYRLLDMTEEGLAVLDGDKFTCFGSYKMYRSLFRFVN